MDETDSVLALTTRLARASYSHIMALAQWRNQHTGTQRATWWQTLAAPRRVDLLIALGLLIWALPDVPWWWRPPGHAGPAPAELGALALTVAMSIPFYWRRRFPLPVLALAGAVLAIRAGLQHNIMSAFAAVLVGCYGLGAYGTASRRYGRWLGWLALATAVGVVTTSNYDRLAGVPFALVGAAFVLGDATSARRAESAAAVEAAHQAERTRIARELHDVVAHQLSAIAVQAGAARMAAGPRADPVVASIETLSRAALTELNHLLGALRQEPDASPVQPPAPTLADLGQLLADSRDAGVPARLESSGAARPLAAGVELAAYRIIQEALANVARHAPGAQAEVSVRYDADQLLLSVTNGAAPGRRLAGAGPHGPGGGRGIRGMRERAELHHGQLTAAARPDGGFAVTAAIPYGEPPPAAPPPFAEPPPPAERPAARPLAAERAAETRPA